MSRILLLVLALAVAVGALWFAADRGEREEAPVEAVDTEEREENEAHAEVATDLEREDVATTEPSDTPVPALRGKTLVEGRLVLPRERSAVLTFEVRRNRRANETPFAYPSPTDLDGRFTVRGLEPGDYRIVAVDESLPSGFVHRFRLAKDQELDLGDIHVPIPASLSGRVIGDNGVPLPNVRVFHGFRAGYSTPQFNRRAVDEDDPAFDPFAMTDADGRFEFTNLSGGTHFLLVESPPWRDFQKRIKLRSGRDKDVGDLQLQSGKTLDGRVVDPNGAPIVGAIAAPTGGIMVGTPHLRKQATTDADGRFQIVGMSSRDGLQVSARGYERFDLRGIQWGELPLVVELKPAAILAGRVSGHGSAAAFIRVEVDPDTRWMPPRAAFSILSREIPCADDGAFRVEGLPAGRYLVRAEAKGVGAAQPVAVDLKPGLEPLELPILAFTEVEIVVRNDRGDPVPDAELIDDRSIRSYPSLFETIDDAAIQRVERHRRGRRVRKARTDENGVTRLGLEPGHAAAIGAFHEDYLPSVEVFAADAWPERIEVTMSRAAHLTGTVSDVSHRDKFSISISVWPTSEGDTPSDDRDSRKKGARVDASGRFELRGLRPDTYHVALNRFDMTWEDDPARKLANATPILGDGLAENARTTVALAPGETTDVTIESTEIGVIEGTVTAGGTPAKGVVVYAVPHGARSRRRAGTDLQESEGYRWVPHTKTADDGSYRFFFASPGDWDFRVEHPRCAVLPEPTHVRATTRGARIRQDFVLSGARVEGRIDMASVPEGHRKTVEVILFAIDDAAEDAFYMPHHGAALAWSMRKVAPDADGRFAFEFVPRGDWIARVIVRSSSMIWQGRARTERNETVQLGDLRAGNPDERVAVKLQSIVPPSEKPTEGQPRVGPFGIRLRRVWPGTEHLVFVQTIGHLQATTELRLEPGEYAAEGFVSVGHFGQHTEAGSTRRFTVRADGTTEPGIVDFR